MIRMFLFALKMCVADMKRCMHRFWWLIPVLVILIVVAPFHDAEMYAITYLICMTLFFIVPRYSRIHFVVPLDEKQLKKFFVWRIVIVCIAMLLIAAVFIGISEWQKWSWEMKGFHWLFGYLAMYIAGSEVGLEGLGMKKDFKIGVRQVVAIVVCVACLFMGVIAMDYIPLKWGLVLSFAMVLLAVVDMILYMREIKMEDYTYVPLSVGENGKVERD